jgi:hypothetical protein
VTRGTGEGLGGVDPDEVWVEMFHGTSGSAGSSIRRDGLRFVDLTLEAERVADELDLDVEVLCETAGRLGYTKVGNARSTSVSVAGHPIYAARYAGVEGGEARREFYKAAWLLLHRSDDHSAAEAWSFERTRAERLLAVLRLPLRVVQHDAGRNRLGEPIGLASIDRQINLRIQREIPAMWVVDVRPVDRVMESREVRREYGTEPDLRELPSDGPRSRQAIWWESSVQRFFSGAQRPGGVGDEPPRNLAGGARPPRCGR